ncbi:hypothetical protein IL992_43435 [Microbispora sp. NEAU-D428]|uniref:hypothetical protein n=1 Tax=Microbispora sitophila TaxID=2771537 RepID=UPI0018678CC9|nr:hypothetical protein [Microbispora sitophila]MBE3015963.1 hypothetical protein [Microbispora sitophila]
MTVTRRGSARGLRSVVLVAALLAPAILASGMLMADFSGYGERVRSDLSREAAVRAEPAGTADGKPAGAAGETAGDRASAGTLGERPAVLPNLADGQEARGIAVVPMAGTVREPLLNPTPVPEPSGPARLYEGIVRILPVVQPVREVVHRDAPKVSRPVEKPEPREETTFRCAPEWRDTWLWELCREREGQAEGGR